MGASEGLRTAGIVRRPALLQRLADAARVTLVTAPAGSGKTVAVRSWIDDDASGPPTAWISVGRRMRDAPQFWASFVDAVRLAESAAEICPLTPAPELDTWAAVERLLEDLQSIEKPLRIVIDDAHELRAPDVYAQLELLLRSAPSTVRFIFVSRYDLPIRLHRLRVDGELTELRERDVRFTRDEARALLDDAALMLSDAAHERLYERTEGWAAGLRLAALSLAGHPAPEEFAAEFSGSERTVAEYLAAEVLEHQTDEVRQLLLRTSILEHVNGELADLLTGGTAGAGILDALERGNAFVVARDAKRESFRYHHLFADLLQAELRRVDGGDVAGLHAQAAAWYAEHGYPTEAVRHAQAAKDWSFAAHVLADHWIALRLDGRSATAHDLLRGFPAALTQGNAELMLLGAQDLLERGSLDEAERQLTAAVTASAEVAEERRAWFDVMLRVVRLGIARQRSDLVAVNHELQHLLAPGPFDPSTALLGEDLPALALLCLGVAEFLSTRIEDATDHLNETIAAAQRIGRPYLEIAALGYLAQALVYTAPDRCLAAARGAVDIAERHGWANEIVLAPAYTALAIVLNARGRLDEAGEIFDVSERLLAAGVEPALALLHHHTLAMWALMRGRDDDALRFAETAGRLADALRNPLRRTWQRGYMLGFLARCGEFERLDGMIAELDDDERANPMIRIGQAWASLARGEPHTATGHLAPLFDGSPFPTYLSWHRGHAYLLAAMAHDALDEDDAAHAALETALAASAPERMQWSFLVHRPTTLLARHLERGTAYASFTADLLGGLDANASARVNVNESVPLLTETELRVLRYLPSALSGPEIANELYCSLSTVKTHMRHLYEKLGVHRRTEAVERARALGLVASR